MVINLRHNIENLKLNSCVQWVIEILIKDVVDRRTKEKTMLVKKNNFYNLQLIIFAMFNTYQMFIFKLNTL